MEEAEVLEEKIIYIFFHFPQKIRRMEEARQKNSQDPSKTLEMLEEWKKLWKKKIIQYYEKYFYSFTTEYWKNVGS